MSQEDESGTASADPAAAPDAPAPDAKAQEPGPAAAAADWPRCGYCGSLALHESSRGGLRERALRFAGCTVYRCEGCGRRFGFAALGHRHRHRHGHAHHQTREPQVVSAGRRRLIRALTVALAVLATFLAAIWLINRDEQRALEPKSTGPLLQ